MHRRYRPWHYAEKLAAIRERMPDAAIGADVMVGFPGETEALFEESIAFIANTTVYVPASVSFFGAPGNACLAAAAASPGSAPGRCGAHGAAPPV